MTSSLPPPPDFSLEASHPKNFLFQDIESIRTEAQRYIFERKSSPHVVNDLECLEIYALAKNSLKKKFDKTETAFQENHFLEQKSDLKQSDEQDENKPVFQDKEFEDKNLESRDFINNELNDKVLGNEDVNVTDTDKKDICDSLMKTDIEKLVENIQREREGLVTKIRETLGKVKHRWGSLLEEEAFFTARDSKGQLVPSNPSNEFEFLLKERNLSYNLRSDFRIFTTFKEHLKRVTLYQRTKSFERYQRLLEGSEQEEGRLFDQTCCQVCNSTEIEDKNHLVYCSLCSIAVHQSCYPIYPLPEGDFICDLCKQFGPRGPMLRCFLCPCRGGVLRPIQIFIGNTKIVDKNVTFKQLRESKKVEARPYWPEQYAAFLRSRGEEPGQQKSSSSSWEKVIEPRRTSKKFRRQKSRWRGAKSSSTVETPVVEEGLYDYFLQTFRFSAEELAEEPMPENLWCHLSCLQWLPGLGVNAKGRTIRARGIEQLTRQSFEEICDVCHLANGVCAPCNRSGCEAKFHVECGRRARLSLLYEPQGLPVAYCPPHSPLLFSEALADDRVMIKHLIIRGIRAVTAFFRTARLHAPQTENVETSPEPQLIRRKTGPRRRSIQIKEESSPVKQKGKEEKEVEESPVVSNDSRYLTADLISTLVRVKREMKDEQNYFLRINLSRKVTDFSITSISFNKSFLEHPLKAKSEIIRKVARASGLMPIDVFETYMIGLLAIKNGYKIKPPSPTITPIKSKKRTRKEKEDPICICQKIWSGELVICCGHCRKWFHLSCIQVRQVEEDELKKYHILCIDCRQLIRNIRGPSVNFVNPEMYLEP